MRRKIILLFIFCCFSCIQTLNAQEVDYLKIRNSIVILGCSDFDTAALFEVHRKLIKLDTNSLTKNKNEYFKDFGWSYYKLAAKLKDSLMMEYTIYNFNRAFQLDNNDWQSLGNLCNALSLNKHCAELIFLTPILTQITPRKNRKELDTEDYFRTCKSKYWWFRY